MAGLFPALRPLLPLCLHPNVGIAGSFPPYRTIRRKQKQNRSGLLKVGSLACRLEQQISRPICAPDSAVIVNSGPRISLTGVFEVGAIENRESALCSLLLTIEGANPHKVFNSF